MSNDLRTKANREEDEGKRLQGRLAGRKRAGADAQEVSSLGAEIAALEKSSKEGFDAAGGAVNIQQLLDGYDVIPEGTVMTNRIRLIEGTDVEMALLLLALDLLARRPLIGGHTAHGCGEIAGVWRARIQTADALVDAGTLRLEPFAGLQLESDNPALVAAHHNASDLDHTQLLSFDLSSF